MQETNFSASYFQLVISTTQKLVLSGLYHISSIPLLFSRLLIKIVNKKLIN